LRLPVEGLIGGAFGEIPSPVAERPEEASVASKLALDRIHRHGRRRHPPKPLG
jgi:hypothetical protein